MPVSWLLTETLINVEPEVWKRNANMNFSCWKVEGVQVMMWWMEGFRVMGGEGWVVDIGGNRTSDIIIVGVEDDGSPESHTGQFWIVWIWYQNKLSFVAVKFKEICCEPRFNFRQAVSEGGWRWLW